MSARDVLLEVEKYRTSPNSKVPELMQKMINNATWPRQKRQASGICEGKGIDFFASQILHCRNFTNCQ